jgi:hypothetical protein
MRFMYFTAVFLCAGCATSGMPREVVDIARSTTVAGAFHVEYDADGRVVEAAGAVPLEAVPAKCRASADADRPGGRQTGAERVYVDGAMGWMVAMEIDGRALEILLRDDGTALGGEEVLPQSAWPAAVVQAAKAAVPGASLERVERVWGAEIRGAEAYHLKFLDRGESVRVGVSEDAKVLRVVRRLAAQVRVPR